MPADETQRILQRLFSSRHFVHARSLRRILEFVCEQTREPGAESLKEYEIAVGASLRPESFDPKTDPIIRVSISGIRERLAAYFAAEGRDEAFRLAIPKGEYRAVFTRAEPGGGGAAETLARRTFWADYMSLGRPNLMLFAETLFFRDDEGNYLRNIYVNDLDRGLTSIESEWPGVGGRGFRPSYNFVPAGEVQSLISLKAAFDAMGVPVEARNARFLTWSDLREANLVLIGSTRTNPFVAQLARGEPFALEEKVIRNIEPRPGEEAEYRGRRFVEGSLERSTEIALVTRRPAMVGGGTVTIVSANHGRGIEGAGDYLTREDALADLAARLSGPERRLPRHFQVLLRVEMIDFDEEVVEVDYLTHRVIET